MSLTQCQLLIVFGGSFDPPHEGHLTLPFAAREQLSKTSGIDKSKILIGFIPAALSPLKTSAPSANAQQRLEMLNLALENKDGAIIITDEIERKDANNPSYTIDTLKTLRRRLADSATMRLLIGADQMLDFEKWKDYKQIITLAEPAVMLRPPHTRQSALAALPPDKRSAWQKRLIDVPQLNISATAIRKRIGQGKSISDLVPPKIEQYIKRNHLYKHPNL